MEPTDDYALTVARIFQRERPDNLDFAGWPGPWPEVARAGITALDNGSDPGPAIEAAIDEHGNGDSDAIRSQLYEAAGRLFSEPEPVPDLPDCPPLPDGVQPDPALGVGAGQWVDVYTGQAAAISPIERSVCR